MNVQEDQNLQLVAKPKESHQIVISVKSRLDNRDLTNF